MSILNYNPDYGLPDSFRQEILDHAENHGVAHASKTFNVGQTTIYKWRRDRKALKEKEHLQ